MTRKRRSFSPEFKQEAASLVLAGEHCSHIPAWLEGGVLSALDAIERLDQRENS